jgi:hypothetical protein
MEEKVEGREDEGGVSVVGASVFREEKEDGGAKRELGILNYGL